MNPKSNPQPKTQHTQLNHLIQEHFKILTHSVREHSGSVVKTMGDAVMATFSLPQDGVSAAVGMIKGVQSLNGRLKAENHELGLKACGLSYFL